MCLCICNVLDALLEVCEELKSPTRRMQRYFSDLYCDSCFLACNQIFGSGSLTRGFSRMQVLVGQTSYGRLLLIRVRLRPLEVPGCDNNLKVGDVSCHMGLLTDLNLSKSHRGSGCLLVCY